MKRRALAMMMALAVAVTSLPGSAVTALASEDLLVEASEDAGQELPSSDSELSGEIFEGENAGPEEASDLSETAAESDSTVWDDLIIEEEEEAVSDSPSPAAPETQEMIPEEAPDGMTDAEQQEETQQEALDGADAPGEEMAGPDSLAPEVPEAEDAEVVDLLVEEEAAEEQQELAAEGTEVIASLSFEDEALEMGVFDVASALFTLPVTVTYEDGTTETISSWGSARVSEVDEGGDPIGGYSCREQTTARGKTLRMELQKAGTPVSIPQLGDDTVPLNELTLKVYEKDVANPKSAELSVTLGNYSKQTVEVPLGGSYVIESLPEEESDYCSFTASEDGNYVIRWPFVSGEVSPYLYRMETDSLQQINLEAEGSYSGSLKAGETYLLVLKGWGAEYGTVTFAQKKTVSSYQLSCQKQYNALTLEEKLREASVTVTYNDGTSETVNGWVNDNYKGKAYLRGETGQGASIALRLDDASGNQVSISSSIPLGDYRLGVYTMTDGMFGDEPVASADAVAVGLPADAELAGTLTPGPESFKAHLEEGEEKIYSFTPRTAGTYVLDLSGDLIGSVEVYQYNGEANCLESQGLSWFNEAGKIQHSFKSGNRYYLMLRGEESGGSVTAVFQYVPEIKSMELVTDPKRTEFIQGFYTDEGVDGNYSLEGMQLKLTYAGGSAVTLDLDDREYGWMDGYGTWIDCEVWGLTNGAPDAEKKQSNFLLLEVGDYAAVAVTEAYAGEAPVWKPFTILSREAAAGRHSFQEGTVSFENSNGYYVGACYTPQTDGMHSFASDKMMEEVRVFDAMGVAVPVLRNSQCGFSFQAAANTAYQMFVKPGRDSNGFTLTEEVCSQIADVTLLPVMTGKQLIAGLDGFNLNDWKVQVTYQDSGDKVVLKEEERDAYGNAFLCEIKEKGTGRVIGTGQYVETMEAGTYLVTAVHETLPELRSNSVEVTYEAVDVSSLPQAKENQEISLARSSGHQMFAFTPSQTGYYRLNGDSELQYGFYFPGETGLAAAGEYLTTGTTYILSVNYCVKAQKVAVTQVSQQAFQDSSALQLTLAGKGKEAYMVTAPETARYLLLGTASQGRTDFDFSLLSVEDGIDTSSDVCGEAMDKHCISWYLKAGKKYLLTVQNRGEQPMELLLTLEKAQKPTEIQVSKKELAEPVPAMALGQLGVDRLFDIRLVYADGVTEKVESWQKDSRGNTVSYNTWSGDNGIRYEFYVEIDEEPIVECEYPGADLSALPELQADTDTSFTVGEMNWKFFRFTPKTSGRYLIQAAGEKSKYACYISDFNSTVIVPVDREGVDLTAGTSYVVEAEVSEGYVDGTETVPEEATIRISSVADSGKQVRSLTLLTPAQPRYRDVAYSPFGMTAKAVYADGTEKVISCDDYTDGFGNDVFTEEGLLPGERSRVTLFCGSCYVSCEVKNLTAEDLPVLGAETGTEYEIPGTAQLLGVFAPTVSATYGLEAGFEGTMPKTPLARDLETGETWLLPSALEAGKRYVVWTDIFSQTAQTVTLRMTNLDLEACRDGHTWNTVKTIDKQPNCTEAGSQSIHCSVCGAIKEGSQENLPALGHTGGTATCKTQAVCTRCKKSYGALAAHKPGTWTETKAATCAAAGTQTQKCTVCGTVTGTQTIPATGQHTWTGWSVTRAATALAAGAESRRCSVCGASESRATAKLTPTLKLNVTSLPLKVKQSTTKVKVSGLAAGDYVKSWKSNKTSVAKVDKKGKITAQNKTGKAVITVTLASGKTGKINVTVQKGNVKTTSVSVEGSKKITLAKGKKVTLKPVVNPITSLDKVKFTSSNKSVAAVDSKGKVTAKKSGTAKITISAGSKKCVVTVKVPKVATKSIKGVPKTATLKKGKSLALKVKLTPSNSEDKITYKSSNTKVATVNSKGKITGKKKGTAVITVKSGSKTVKCTVTVK